MRLSEIINTVINIIANEMHILSDRINIADSLDEFGIDSLDRFEIKISIERKFNIVLPHNKFWSAKYIDDIVVLSLDAMPFFEVKLDHIGKLKTKFYLDKEDVYG